MHVCHIFPVTMWGMQTATKKKKMEMAGLDKPSTWTHVEEMITALPSKHYSGQHNAAEDENYQVTPRKRSERNVDSRFQVQL